jgi:hypothetical protein
MELHKGILKGSWFAIPSKTLCSCVLAGVGHRQAGREGNLWDHPGHPGVRRPGWLFGCPGPVLFLRREDPNRGDGERRAGGQYAVLCAGGAPTARGADI